MPGSHHETEIKLAVTDAATARHLLRRARFRVFRRRIFERNTLFDTPSQALRAAGCLLRVREAGRISTATYKGPGAAGPHKSREELEFGITDAKTMALMLQRIGFEPTFRYEKYRTELRQPRSKGIATVDETPIGIFLELEGDPKWIDRAAKTLGFSTDDYITASYGRLYLDWCRAQGVEPTHMVFPGPAPG